MKTILRVLKIAQIPFIILITKIIEFVVLIFIILVIYIVDLSDYIFYKNSVETKEDIFEMLCQNQDEYEQLVEQINNKYVENAEESIILRGRTEFDQYGIQSKLFKEFPIYVIYAKEKEGYMKIEFDFKFPPNPYTTWGIYFSESNEPVVWGAGVLKEEDGVFVENGSYYKYETEKIIENWYYYQCWTR